MAEKRFDCVQMMRDIRDRLTREEEGLSPEQRRDKTHREAEAAFRELFGRQQAGPASDEARQPPRAG